jgi:hypothetical protein
MAAGSVGAATRGGEAGQLAMSPSYTMRDLDDVRRGSGLFVTREITNL